MPNRTKQNDAVAAPSFSPADLDAKGFPAPDEGFLITYLLIVADQNRSRDFYSHVLGGKIIRERDPAVVRLNNSWVVINSAGGPTDDKLDVIAAAPESSHVVISGLNIRVADVWAIYHEWSARGAQFLTEPKDHGQEIRCYIRDPDGHLIEVGQLPEYSLKANTLLVLQDLSCRALPSNGRFRPTQKVQGTEKRGCYSGAMENRRDTDRIEAFSDGVFAVAITLLVLDLKVPPPNGGDGGQLLRGRPRPPTTRAPFARRCR